MRKSEVQETVASLYLRLNGYFVSGFIVHATDQVKTEIDLLAVRFPYHEEPEREIKCCQYLSPPDGRVDFIVGEVKGGSGKLGFNRRFREDPEAIRTVLRRVGAFKSADIERVCREAPARLEAKDDAEPEPFPCFVAADGSAQIRFVVFAMEQTRASEEAGPYLYSSDALGYVWKCFRPEKERQDCAVRYNFNLWGPQLTRTVRYFKDKARLTPGNIADLYAFHDATD